MVDLDQLACPGGFHAIAPAFGVALVEVAAPFGAQAALVEGTGTDATQAHSLGQDTTHRRDAAGEPVLLLQEDVQAKFAAKGIAASQLPDVVFVSVGPLMGADPAGTPRASDEAGQAGSVQSLPPPVVGGSGAGDRLQCQLLGTALAAEPVVEAEFLPALDGLLGSRVVNGQPAVQWVGQSLICMLQVLLVVVHTKAT